MKPTRLSDDVLLFDVLPYLEVHAEKMGERGWHMTARVLEEAHKEIVRLRQKVKDLDEASS